MPNPRLRSIRGLRAEVKRLGSKPLPVLRLRVRLTCDGLAFENLSPEEQEKLRAAGLQPRADEEVEDEVERELQAALAALPPPAEEQIAVFRGQATPAEGQRMPVYGLKELPATGGTKATTPSIESRGQA
jgi:hypothetical protein